MKYTAIVNGKTYEVEIERASTGRSIGHAAAPAAAPVQAAGRSGPGSSPRTCACTQSRSGSRCKRQRCRQPHARQHP